MQLLNSLGLWQKGEQTFLIVWEPVKFTAILCQVFQTVWANRRQSASSEKPAFLVPVVSCELAPNHSPFIQTYSLGGTNS